MTKKTTELQLIHKINSLGEEISALTSERTEALVLRDRYHVERDRKALEESTRALRSIEEDIDQKAQAHTAAKDAQKALERRLDAGDASVTVEDLSTAKVAVDRAQRLLNAARKPLHEARADYAIDSSDNLLAGLAVETIREHSARLGISGADVYASKRPESHEPAVLPAAVVAQRTNTRDMDKAIKSGDVEVSLHGCELDSEALVSVFRDEGHEVSYDGKVLRFHEAFWETPILPSPSLPMLQKFGRDVADLFRHQVPVQRIGESDFPVHLVSVSAAAKTGDWSIEGGSATGIVIIDAQWDGNAPQGHPLATMNHTVSEFIGKSTDMGRIEDIKVEVEELKTSPRTIMLGGYGGVQKPGGIKADEAVRFTISLATTFQPLGGSK